MKLHARLFRLLIPVKLRFASVTSVTNCSFQDQPVRQNLNDDGDISEAMLFGEKSHSNC